MLVIANETAASTTLLAALRDLDPEETPDDGRRAGERAEPGLRRLRRHTPRVCGAADGRQTLEALRERGFSAQGFVVDSGPVQAVKDALAQLEPRVDEIIVSTHGAERSGWMRRNVVEDITRVAGDIPVKHVTVERDADEATNVLVIANQTVVSDELLDKIRARAAQGKSAFLIVAPQGDGEQHADSDRRLRRALTELGGEGIVAHGQIVHPDPYTAAMNVVHDERVDEIIVSTFPGERSGWLRRDLVARLAKDTGKPVTHVVSPARQEVGVA